MVTSKRRKFYDRPWHSVKLFRFVTASPYRGYLPIEKLSAGDPFLIVPPFLKQVKDAMENV